MGVSAAAHVNPWILYTAILLLLGYVVLDLASNHSNISPLTACGPVMEAPPIRLDELPMADEEARVCRTLEGHMNMSARSPDPWRQMKWVGEAARCRVKGHLIEKLDPDNNFRRGFALRFTDDVEDKSHVLPWLLATRQDLGSAARRVYIDLGANALSTSITWFMRMYPVDFTEVHAFEVDQNLLRMPAPREVFKEGGNYEQPNQWARVAHATPQIPQWMLDRITMYHEFVSDFDDKDANSVNITRFIKEKLKLRPADTVVVKMDIEGSEWPILRRWMHDSEMISIIDELFVEVHYDHPSMRGYHWARFAPISRDEAFRVLAELRLHGYFVHAWP